MSSLSPQTINWRTFVSNLLEQQTIEDCERKQVADHIVASKYDQVWNLIGIVVCIADGPNHKDSSADHYLNEDREADYSADDEAGVDSWIELHLFDNLECVNDVPYRVHDRREGGQTVSQVEAAIDLMVLLDSIMRAIWWCEEDYDWVYDFNDRSNGCSGKEVPLYIFKLLFRLWLEQVEEFDSKFNTQSKTLLVYLHVIYAYSHYQVRAYQGQ